MKTSYDRSTDSLYVEIRPDPSCRTVEIAEDIMVDYGADGQPTGYDIQHASTKTDFIASLILEQRRRLRPSRPKWVARIAVYLGGDREII